MPSYPLYTIYGE
jgi:hypothetical protein